MPALTLKKEKRIAQFLVQITRQKAHCNMTSKKRGAEQKEGQFPKYIAII